MPGHCSGHHRFARAIFLRQKIIAKNFFTISVERIFTVLITPAFTKSLDRPGPKRGGVLPVSAAHHRLTPSQPKFDNTKKDRIARMY